MSEPRDVVGRVTFGAGLLCILLGSRLIEYFEPFVYVLTVALLPPHPHVFEVLFH